MGGATESSPLKAGDKQGGRQYALLSLIVTTMLVDSAYINEVRASCCSQPRPPQPVPTSFCVAGEDACSQP